VAPTRRDQFLELDFSVMTALYGGGAEAGKNDVEDPFRVPSIRGHLRFWWRATIGGRFTDVESLRNAEAKVWGDTDQASGVRIRVLHADRGTERPAACTGPDGRWQKVQPDYALFPAQEDRKQIKNLYFGGRFRLEVSASEDLQNDVDAALWAWVTFGGIGGRTRRGAGSLQCAQYTYAWRAEAMRGDGGGRPWPVLKGGCVVMGSRKQEWQKCWVECINLLKEFRQDRYRPMGRSRWPEPDEIRRITGQAAPEHQPVNQERGFPRAALGLPIMFRFNQRKSPEDPDPTTLNVFDSDDVQLRFASPVILKPWAISANEAIPLLVVLNAPKPDNVKLKYGNGRPEPVTVGGDALAELASSAERAWDGRRLDL
jgi:CRISPR-associated protein Cmr1